MERRKRNLEKELLKCVKRMGHANVSGSAHSKIFSVDSREIVNTINIHDLSLSEAYKVTNKHLTCAAGLTLGEIRDLLKPYAKRLRGTPEADTISLGGALSVGAH